MAILQGAIVKIIKRHDTPRVGARGICLHIAVSNGASLHNYFDQAGNPTSHFYVRRTGDTDGMADFEQYVDTRYQAPANLEGNRTLISIETQGGVDDDLDNPWPANMVKRLAWIVAECHRLEDIPIQAMPNSKLSSRGVGYHRLGVDPWRVNGGEKWSAAYGKVCPGNARIAQIPTILARARELASTPTEDTMSAADVQALKTYIDQKFATFGPGGNESERWAQQIREGREQTAQLLAVQQALLDKMLADDTVETGRYEQEINESRGQYERAMAAIATVIEQTAPPVEPPAPKA